MNLSYVKMYVPKVNNKKFLFYTTAEKLHANSLVSRAERWPFAVLLRKLKSSGGVVLLKRFRDRKLKFSYK